MLGMMPTVMETTRGEKIFGLKVLSIFNTNLGTPHHAHQGAVLLFEGVYGQMQAIVDAFSITKCALETVKHPINFYPPKTLLLYKRVLRIRTAAVSGLATRLLARTDDNAGLVCAILGSGPQAESHIDAMATVRKISKFVVWTRTTANAFALQQKFASRGFSVPIEVVQTAKEAVKDADIICALTAAKEPIFERGWLKPGVHINAVGAHTPSTREIDSLTVRDARVFADKRESLLAEGGDFVIPMKEGLVTESHIVAELSELVNNPSLGRRSDSDLTVFKSLGLALEDLAAVKLVYDRCRDSNLGAWKQMCEPPKTS